MVTKVDADMVQGLVTSTGNQTITTTDAGATTGPQFDLYRDSSSPLAADDIGSVLFSGKDSGGTKTSYAEARAVIVDPTDGSEDGKLTVRTVVAGAFAERASFGAGLSMAGATGGDPGAGKINATAVQLNSQEIIPFDRHFILLTDQKAAGTDAGTFTQGAWQTRTLTNEDYDFGNYCTLAGNQFTLVAGTYVIDAEAPAGVVNNHQAKLRNITAGSDSLIGTSEYTGSGDTTYTKSRIMGRVTFASAQTFEIQHQCQTTKATDGFGNACNFGVTEVYTTVRIWRVL